jgi:hypothetical protein
LLFLSLGLILLLGNMSSFPARPLLARWWPILLVIAGVKQLILRRRRLYWISSVFWIGTGALFLSSTLGFLDIGIARLLWPLMLIWFGVLIIVGSDTNCGPVSERSEP